MRLFVFSLILFSINACDVEPEIQNGRGKFIKANPSEDANADIADTDANNNPGQDPINNSDELQLPSDVQFGDYTKVISSELQTPTQKAYSLNLAVAGIEEGGSIDEIVLPVTIEYSASNATDLTSLDPENLPVSYITLQDASGVELFRTTRQKSSIQLNLKIPEQEGAYKLKVEPIEQDSQPYTMPEPQEINFSYGDQESP